MRFPADFMFQLNDSEFQNWKSRFATSNSIKMGARKKPYAFTELINDDTAAARSPLVQGCGLKRGSCTFFFVHMLFQICQRYDFVSDPQQYSQNYFLRFSCLIRRKIRRLAEGWRKKCQKIFFAAIDILSIFTRFFLLAKTV